MKRYLLLYNCVNDESVELSEDDRKELLQRWQNWIEKMGDYLIDIGHDIGESTMLVDDGSIDDATDLRGYSIIQAEAIEKAVELCEHHPFLINEDGNYGIEIHELGDITYP